MGCIMSKSAEKSLMVLKIVGSSDRPLGLLEIAGLASFDKSTTARLLATLGSMGFVRRDVTSRCYSAGPTLISLASFAMGQLNLVKVAKADLIRLRDLTGETVSLHARQQHYRVCVDGVESLQNIRRAVPWGGQLPLYEGPSGKAITAFLSERDLDDVMRQAEQDGTDRKILDAALEEIRAKGFAMGVGDRTPDIGAISVPIFDREGVVGAITIAGPSDRWTVMRMRSFADEVLRTGKNLSALLGAPMAVTS